uniref:Uncharacterized protein n=1 Tax=Oryza brachyantha TaxID=4533 RepID=J3LLL5_ORYBR
MAMRVEEEAEAEESAPAAAFLRRIMACGPSAWRAPTSASSSLVAAEAGGVEIMSVLPGYQRIPSAYGTALPDDADDGASGARSSSSPACLPRGSWLLWGALTRAVQRGWHRGDEEAEATAKESSWRRAPDRRWPVQGWC